MNWEIFGVAIYVVGMIALGFYFSKRIKTDDDYFLGGRSLGPGIATFAIFATWFGAETCIGTAGAVYRSGLSSVHADPFGYALCLLIMGLFFAKVLWQKKITTIPDLLRQRYSGTTEKMSALIMIPSSVIWAGAQVRALGQILEATTELSPVIAVTAAAIVVIIYTMWGGMLADAYADIIQGIAIILGLFFLAWIVVWDLGGPVEVLKIIPKEKLSFSGGDYEGLGALGKLELWLVPILGSVLTQELVSRVAASRSAGIAVSSTYRAALMYALVGSIPVLVGLIGASYFPTLENSESLMPALAKMHLNPFFYVIFVGALVSAILSTVDTTLLASSALLSHNLIYPGIKGLSENKKVRIARLGTLGSGIVAYVIAFSSDSITELVETASSLGGPSILIIAIAALWDKRGTSVNANFAIIMSVLAWIVFHFFVEISFPVLLTVLVCAVSYVGSLLFTAHLSAKSHSKDKVNLDSLT